VPHAGGIAVLEPVVGGYPRIKSPLCSGDMYWKVSMIMPCEDRGPEWVRVSLALEATTAAATTVEMSRAIPKSSSLAPCPVSMTFAGLRSQWMMPRRRALESTPAMEILWLLGAGGMGEVRCTCFGLFAGKGPWDRLLMGVQLRYNARAS
jgi:hypothetical protein